MREQRSGFEKMPLFGYRILVTRAQSQARAFSTRIEELGGEAVEFPVIRILPVKDAGPLDQALDELERFDWAVFTSVNAVEYFFHRLRQRRLDIGRLRARIAAVGPKTKEALEARGLRVHVFPEIYHAEGLLDVLLKQVRPGTRLLFPKSKIARDIIPRKLADHGVDVRAVDVYENSLVRDRVEELVALLEAGSIHVLTFTSSSTVRNFLQLLCGHDVSRLLKDVKVASIGPLTSATCRELGLEVTIEAKHSSMDGLVDALVAMAQAEKQEGRMPCE